MIAGSSDDMGLSLVALWGMDEGEGLVVNDANDGVIVGGATWTDGICGNALKFAVWRVESNFKLLS